MTLAARARAWVRRLASPSLSGATAPARRATAGFSCAGIDWNLAEADALLESVLPRWAAEFGAFPAQSEDPTAYHHENPFFSLVDAAVLHAFVRERRPPAVVEVGSGFSSRVTAAALRRNGAGRLVCIDPEPRAAIDAVADELRRVPVQDVPVAFFEALPDRSFLFVDSSHRVETGGDVTYLFLEVLPRLPGGTLVHVHDVFLPDDYPEAWSDWGYAEQYLLHALLAGSHDFRVVWPGRKLMRSRYEKLHALFPGDGLLGLHCSFWLERR